MESITASTDFTADFTPEDIQQNKVSAILAYFLFFIPLLMSPNSPFSKFHANQSLILLITNVVLMTAAVIVSFILGMIPIIGMIGMLIPPIIGLGVFALFVIGLINAAQGSAKELPLIGKYRIIK